MNLTRHCVGNLARSNATTVPAILDAVTSASHDLDAPGQSEQQSKTLALTLKM